MSYAMSGSAMVSVFCTLTGVPEQSSPSSERLRVGRQVGASWESDKVGSLWVNTWLTHVFWNFFDVSVVSQCVLAVVDLFLSP